MNAQKRPLTIKEWKVLETFFSATRPVREGLELQLVVEKECPVFIGKQSNFDGDPKVSVRMTQGNLKLRLSWAEANNLADLIAEARATCTEKALAVEEECTKRRAERAQKKAEREASAESVESSSYGGNRKRTPHTGKTARLKAEGKAGEAFHRKKKMEHSEQSREIAQKLGKS